MFWFLAAFSAWVAIRQFCTCGVSQAITLYGKLDDENLEAAKVFQWLAIAKGVALLGLAAYFVRIA
jgi:hypothetical protein